MAIDHAKGVTTGVLANVLERMGAATRAVIDRALEPVMKRSAELEERVLALEARANGGMKFVGIWREGLGYEPGSVATHGGSMWHCDRTTTAKPGTSADWTLCVKHGGTCDELAH